MVELKTIAAQQQVRNRLFKLTRLLHKLWHVVVTQAPAFSDASARRALSMENVSQHTQHGFATIHDRLDGWFNLTGGELNPHADAA